jgi:ligand-binding SRPBCC domain-containing protein
VYYELTDRFEVPASPEETWAFFSRADNLPEITPPWLNFAMNTPGPIVLGRGRVAQPLAVKRQLLGIFRFRREVIGRRLGGLTPLQPDVEIRRT